MSEWDERIRAHRVWNDMKVLGPTIDSALAGAEISRDSVAGLERIRTVLAYFGKRLAAADPRITNPQPLDLIANNLGLAQSELTAFVSDGSPQHIAIANTAADAILLSAAQIMGADSPEELGELVATSTEYRTTIEHALADARQQIQDFKSLLDESLSKLNSTSEQTLAQLNAKFEDSAKIFNANAEGMQVSLTALANSIKSEQQKLTQIVSDQQGQFSTAQEARSKEFTEGLRLANENYAKLATEYQSQFSAAQDTRSKEYTAAELARQNKYTELIAESNKKLTEQDAEFTKQRTAFVTASEADLTRLVSEYKENAQTVLKDIEEKQKYVEKLVGVIGNLGVTSGYLRVANQARLAQWLWQGATVASLVTLSILAYKTLGVLEGSHGAFSWEGFAARALVLVSLGVIAAYSGTQADKLFGEERRNRKLALELEAIGPYLAPLPIEEQNKFRLQVGEQSFGRDLEAHIHRKSPVSAIDILNSKQSKEFLQSLIEIVAKAKELK
jgi:hypothetical protein